MKPELVDATLKRRSSVDKNVHPDGATQEIEVICQNYRTINVFFTLLIEIWSGR